MTRKKRLPKISINIPLITGGDASVVVAALKSVDYPKHLIEILITEGNQIAAQRNIALLKSKGSIVYLLDNDSRVTKKSLKIIAKEFEDGGLCALGGPSLLYKAAGGSKWGELVSVALETFFGSLRMRFRYSQREGSGGNEYRLIGANLALRKKVILNLGGFNEEIVPNEETELIQRLQKNGYGVKYNKRLYVMREQRKNPIDLSKQFFHYGRGRTRQIVSNFKAEYLVFLLPPIFLVYLLAITAYPNIYSFSVIFLYLILAAATSAKASIKHKNFKLFLPLIFTFPIIHLSYATGIIWELLRVSQTGKFANSHNVSISKPKKILILKKSFLR